MAIQQLTPPQAFTAMQSKPDAVFLDVRSQGEFAEGHPAGALNVPIIFINLETGDRAPNGEFVAVVESIVSDKSRPVFLSCLAGGRSQAAAEQLQQAGYTDLSNVQGGWGGGGGVSGWQASGLPTSTDNGEGVGYESLKTKAGV